MNFYSYQRSRTFTDLCPGLASVAQLDVHLTGDQEVAGSTPTGPATFFHEISSTVILSLLLIQEWQLSVTGKRMCTILVNHLED